MADASLMGIATAMGCSLKHAAAAIERYTALSPEMSDGIADKLAVTRKGS